MKAIAVVGLDLAKQVFQIHGLDAEGGVVIRRQMRRSEVLKFFSSLPPCLVGMEACASAHYWARELMVFGHRVRLMPPHYVKPYVKRSKTDAADAEAIAEAVTRPTMRFVAVKTVDQQAVLMLHKTRDLLVRQRTMLINALRGHLAEYGIIAAKGPAGMGALKTNLSEAQEMLPPLAWVAMQGFTNQLRSLEIEIECIETQILRWHRADPVSRRLVTIPGIGPITASAMAAAVPDASLFRSGRQFAAWLGLTPRAYSSGGRERQAGISKQGDGYLRRLLVVGAIAVMRMARQSAVPRLWLMELLEHKRPKVVAVALANKTARIAWAIMTRNQIYAARAA